MKKNNKGFTLVEMIVTLVIISVLNAVAIFGVKAYLNLSTENILEAMCTLLNEARYEAVSNGCKETHITFEKQGKNYVATIYKDNNVFKQEVVGNSRTNIYIADIGRVSSVYQGYEDYNKPITAITTKSGFYKRAMNNSGNTYANEKVSKLREKSVTYYFNSDGSICDIALNNKKFEHTSGDRWHDATDLRLQNFEIVVLTDKKDGGLKLTTSLEVGKAIISDFIFDEEDNIGQTKSYGVLHNNSEK